VVKYAPGDLSSIDLDAVEANDAVTDTPIPSFYRELDAKYPGSKFILTVRDKDEWLRSCKKQFNQRLAEKQTEAHKRLFLDLYGTDVFDAEKFSRGYETFVKRVYQYFNNRQSDLLVIDIAGGEGWEKLCPFLGAAIPDIPFPKANVTQVRWIDLAAVVTVAREAGDEILRVYSARPDASGLSTSCASGGSPIAANVWDATRRAAAKVAYRVRGGRANAIQRAGALSNAAILRGLRKLTPNIPVVSRLGATISEAQRRRSNHLWLVDPLSSSCEPLDDGEGPTVNIALVEDGMPICGVVYAPLTDTLYYAQPGKGSYRVDRRRNTETRLNRQRAPVSTHVLSCPGCPRLERESSYRHSAEDVMPWLGDLPGRGGCDRELPLHRPSAEWETAAGHVIASCAGKRVCDSSSNEELRYNKPGLINGPFAVW
jgi:3'-phosphoadenosine 5'-phosphosulfate (PAPS) 3'-phosphatase/ribosomal 30S subunit maturation factor RimM